MFGDQARAYAELLGTMGSPARAALMWRASAGTVAACLPAVLLARGCLAPRDGLIALRGSTRHEGREAAARLNALMAARSKARPDHPIAPGVAYPADMWTRHALVVAGTGAGKSTALKPLIKAVVDARESLLLFDPKGEFTKGFDGPEIVAPWDARSLAWDIAKDMRNVGDMRRFATAMVREAQDPMWSNAARQLLVGFLIYLKATRGADWGWGELAQMLSIPQANILPIMSAYHPEAIRAVERASVTTQGILINLASFSASIFDLAHAWGDAPPERRVSFVEWVQQKGSHRQLILQGHGAYPELTKSYLEGALGTVAAIVNSVEIDDDENRKLWLIADEAGQMGKVPIRALLEVGRSRGMRCVLACQDLAQLEEIYGTHMLKALVSMVGTILVGQIMQGDTAEQLCKALGVREVERQNISTSRNGSGFSGQSTTLSFSRDELAIYKPSELASRLGPTQDGKGVKFALLTGGNAYELFWPHYKMRSVRPAHVPAPWTTGFGFERASGGAQELMAPSAAKPSTGHARVGLNPCPIQEEGTESAPAAAEALLNVAASGEVGVPTIPHPPSSTEVSNLLRQSIDVRSVGHAQSPLGGQAIFESEGASQSPSDRPTHQRNHEGLPMAEVLGEWVGESVQHAASHGVVIALKHGVELVDALRAKVGPAQAIVQAQRAPDEPHVDQARNVSAGQSRTKTKGRSSERGS